MGKHLGGWIRPTTRLAIYLRDDVCCVWCGADYYSGRAFTLDHLHPREHEGSNDWGNLVTACWQCNSAGVNRRYTEKTLPPNEQKNVTRRLRTRMARNAQKSAYQQTAQVLWSMPSLPAWVVDLQQRARDCRASTGGAVMAGSTTVVNIRKTPKYDVYIGRPGQGQAGYFGSPVVIGEVCPECGLRHYSAGETLECFEQYARRRAGEDAEYRQKVVSLYGQVLGCFCAPGPCHGHVLAALASEWLRADLAEDDVPF